MHPDRHHAVVIGASIAGLLAARVLAENFQSVTVIDKDVLPDAPAHRRHVPQSHHFHSLLASGREALVALFPGIEDALLAAGARSGDTGRGVRWIIGGHRHCARDAGIRGIAASRILIEDAVRRQVRALAGVRFVTGTDVDGLEADARGRVVGVRVHDSQGSRHLAADLVVDCSGRGSRTPAWLQALGYPAPATEELRIDARYRSRHFRLPAAAMGELRTIIVGARPQLPRYGVIGLQETGLYLCALGGLGGEQAPEDLPGFLDFARSLAAPDLYEVLRQGEAVDAPRAYGMPSNLRRRYEALARFPDGLLVMGDAVCSFNPTYGQGMAVAAQQALKLRLWLAATEPQPLDWFSAIAEVIDAPWSIVTGGDAWALGLPESRRGARRLINAYLAQLHAAATSSPQVADAFLRVANLQAPPASLLTPATMLRVWRTRRAQAPVTPTTIAAESTLR